ncbi:MAG: S-adenosylmethionine:tRNA ribosyltransferase-isomerase [Candidatus Binatota bacterium]|nr:S-adenosylmethionine:tRNA ribosyltransferase-isomerase [Candidatus Binatota bacterium]
MSGRAADTTALTVEHGAPTYDLPPDLIAQFPAARRCESRLMVLDRSLAEPRHDRFENLPQRLRSGDLLVRNDSRVIPARLRGTRAGGGEIEVLLLERLSSGTGFEVWSCLARPGRRLRIGEQAELAGGLHAQWLDAPGTDRVRTVRLESSRPVVECLDAAGEIPLPPYIRRRPTPADRERYQTIYARVPGSVAAPTAGLHFTAETFERLAAGGIEVASLTLHVGAATFLPHGKGAPAELSSETVDVPGETAAAVNRALRERRRVVAVGTTVVRALEGSFDGRDLAAGTRRVSLVIRAGYRFRVIGGLVTNFHLPGTTLLELVAAFAGTAPLLAAYREGIRQGYRFYSYGDAMLVL